MRIRVATAAGMCKRLLGPERCRVSSHALAVLAVVLAGCAQTRPYVPPSEGHIVRPQSGPAVDAAIPPPARVSSFVPPPRPALKPQTYSVVVSEVPVKELLNALVRDTRQN